MDQRTAFIARYVLPAIAAAALSGCGGGSGGSAFPVGNAQPDGRSVEPIAPLTSSLKDDLASGRLRAACPPGGPGVARCLAYQLVDTTLAPKSEVPNIQGYGPTQLQSAYGITSYAQSGGNGMTVAIVDAYSQPNIVSDLAEYRSTFGLPACGTSGGCFKVVNQRGGKKLPEGNSGWGVEISLDTEMVSANCPNCKIILVETDSNSDADLYAGVAEAVKLGGNAVSNSWYEEEYSGEVADGKKYFSHPGVVITACAGDEGYLPAFPSEANTVTSVGGTTLNTAKNSRGWTETVWTGSGGGCSQYETAPSWQKPVEKKLGGCSKRVANDIAYDANPYTGVAVYDTYGEGGWSVWGGTSVGTPAIAAIYMLGGHLAGVPAKYAYEHASELNDVTSGSNGSCNPSWLCNGEVGFDGPTGNGTPNGNKGLDAF